MAANNLIRILNSRLTLGNNILSKNKMSLHKDQHDYLLPNEISYEELAGMFNCTEPKIRQFYKAGIIKIVRQQNRRLAFNRKEAVNILNQYVQNGHLIFKPSKQ